LRDPEVWRWIGGAYADVSLEGEGARIRDILADDDAYHWIIELNGEPLGNINLHEIEDQTHQFGARAACLTYLIGVRSAWGNGIATAVVREVVRWAFYEGGFKTILARVLKQNPASIRVLTNSGFLPAGTEPYDGPDLGEPAIWERLLLLSDVRP
jgi:RimJ/RimL family protein N-acetyltransferase